jgi:hypothetical protein
METAVENSILSLTLTTAAVDKDFHKPVEAPLVLRPICRQSAMESPSETMNFAARVEADFPDNENAL